MAIRCLKVSNLRNLSVDIAPSPKINLFFGENGSGKTSLLESVCFLAVARSFRTKKLRPIIRNGCRSCTVFSEIQSADRVVSAGVTRSLDHQPLIQINGGRAGTAADLACLLPVQLMHPELFTCLEDGPQARRRLIDWGVFHQFPLFWAAWKNMQVSLKQRNGLLKRKTYQAAELSVWTKTFVEASLVVSKLRSDYLALLIPELEALLESMSGLTGLRLSYFHGWSKNTTLDGALEKDVSKDHQYGYTSSGPHRADVKILYQGACAPEILSRGQQKIIVCAIKFAQGKLFEKLHRRACVYLVDDLLSELDEKSCDLLAGVLSEMQSQVWVTGVNEKRLRQIFSKAKEKKVFHVEHGQLALCKN